MSVHAVQRRHFDTGYDARWRTPDGASYSRRFESQAEAEAFDKAIRARIALNKAQALWDAVPAEWKRVVDSELEGV